MRREGRVFHLDQPTIEIIAGDCFTIPFHVLKENGDLVNLQLPNTQIEWTMSPFGETDVLTLKKDNGSVGGVEVSNLQPDMFDVTLDEEDTINISGSYIFQVKITDPNGTVSRRVQGSILIWPNTPDL